MIITYDERCNIPYITKYEKILHLHGIAYDIIYWNRRNLPYVSQPNVFQFQANTQKSRISKIVPFLRWRRFVLKRLGVQHYDMLIVVTTIPGVLLADYLLKGYRRRYVFDIRDFTYEKFVPYGRLVDKLVDGSAMTTISSRGFQSWLGKNSRVHITHNLTNEEAEYPDCVTLGKIPLVVGFLGGLRYESQNRKLLSAFAGSDRFVFSYQGKSHPGWRLEEYCKKNRIFNVRFSSDFQNKDKPLLYREIDLINAVYGADQEEVRTLLPNRLYDCVLYHRPIIVSAGTYVAQVISDYHLGVAIDINQSDMVSKLTQYVERFDHAVFLDGCRALLHLARQEEAETIKALERIFEENKTLL